MESVQLVFDVLCICIDWKMRSGSIGGIILCDYHSLVHLLFKINIFLVIFLVTEISLFQNFKFPCEKITLLRFKTIAIIRIFRTISKNSCILLYYSFDSYNVLLWAIQLIHLIYDIFFAWCVTMWCNLKIVTI